MNPVTTIPAIGEKNRKNGRRIPTARTTRAAKARELTKGVSLHLVPKGAIAKKRTGTFWYQLEADPYAE